MIEPSWDESHESKSLVVDWNQDEEEDMNLRARFIFTYTNDQLKKQNKKIVNEPSSRVVSFFEPSSFDIPLSSLTAGSELIRGKQRRTPIHIQNTAPRTRSQAISKALKQHKVQTKKMSTQGQDSIDGLNFFDGTNGDVQFIEAPKVDQPKFMTLTRDPQVIYVGLTIPTWLSNTINKKRSLQLVTSPVKDILSKYVAQGSKVKKLKMDAHLTKDPVTRKITTEIATYRQKIESKDIDDEGFNVIVVELGTINRSIGNNFFKFSANHMLTQFEKDSKEKKELKGMVMTMAAYINSLMNLGALPIVQAPQAFSPNSTGSQQLVKKMQRGKLQADAMKDWVNAIIKEGNEFILKFNNIYAEGELLLGEIKTLVPGWEIGKNWCQAIVFQVTEVDKFRVLKFLNENPMKNVDPCMLFIMKNNIGLKELVYREAIKEVQGIENKIIGMHEELLKYMKIVNPIGILQFDDGNIDLETLTKSFNEFFEKIRDNESSSANDFIALANIELMLCLNKNLMTCQNLKIKEVKWKKDACQVKLLSLKNPHFHTMQEFMNT